MLDLSRLLPGPYLTRMLVDLGAEVIKIEGPEGDMMRYLPPEIAGHATDYGAAFAALNAGKQSLVLDFKAPQSAAIFSALVAKSDIVVESFRPGVAARLGIGYEQARAANPQIIYCSITGYGQNGPLAQVAGHDLNYLARAGILALCGPAEQPPSVPGVQIADLAGGALQGAVAILAALLQRARTGQGCFLDISMTRGVMGLVSMELARRAMGAPEARGEGTLTGGLPNYRVYATRDGKFMALAALEPKFFAAFCARVGCEELLSAQMSFGANDADAARVTAALTDIFASRTQAEWTALLGDCDCCCEPVLSPEEALQEQGAQNATCSIMGVPLMPFGPWPAQASQNVPRLGEHTERILGNLTLAAHSKPMSNMA